MSFLPLPPRQRNTREKNKRIKEGNGDELWNDKPNKKRHKDIDARWTKKNGETFFGYKNHAKDDAKSKFIDNYEVTDASVHDSQPLDDLLTEDDSGQDFFADSAYTGKEQEKSKTRARVEHVFGFMEQSMNGLIVRVCWHKKSSRNYRLNQFDI